MSSPNGFDVAGSLLARYRRWLEESMGGDLASVQPSSLSELDDLEHFYEPTSGCLLVAAVDGNRPASSAGIDWTPAWAS
ncbi:MAG TPA: hypothetical protein VKA51_03940 [Rubrobacteraceae bacterium]|nr:hypothetical protein [Rubrobacteraceae bacterium]